MAGQYDGVILIDCNYVTSEIRVSSLFFYSSYRLFLITADFCSDFLQL